MPRLNYGDRYDFDRWAQDDDSWNHETGAPGIGIFSRALQVWAAFQNRPLVSVAEAARAFNCDPLRVIEAVNFHPFMYFEGPEDDYTRLVIKHEGE